MHFINLNSSLEGKSLQKSDDSPQDMKGSSSDDNDD